MATKKCSYKVLPASPRALRAGWDIEAWCDDAKQIEAAVQGIEGVVTANGVKTLLAVLVDGRYDINEVMAEVLVIVQEAFDEDV